MESTERVYAADLAKVLKKSPLTARRMLMDLEHEHGAIVVHRDGRERYTTWDALEQVTDLRRPKGEKKFDEAKMMSTLRRLLTLATGNDSRIEELEAKVEEILIRIAKLYMHPAFKTQIGA